MLQLRSLYEPTERGKNERREGNKAKALEFMAL